MGCPPPFLTEKIRLVVFDGVSEKLSIIYVIAAYCILPFSKLIVGKSQVFSKHSYMNRVKRTSKSDNIIQRLPIMIGIQLSCQNNLTLWIREGQGRVV